MNGRTPVGELPNLGPASARMLSGVGIRCLDDLRKAGPIGAWLACRDAGLNASLNLVYAIEGALTGCPWNHLPEDRRQDLKSRVEALKPVRRGR